MPSEDLFSPNSADGQDFPVEDVPVAEVNIGNVGLDDVTFWLVDDSGIWTDYWIVNHYETDRHRYMMPIASPNGFDGNQVAFVQMAAETILWICDWTCERIGQQPTLPTPAPPDDNAVLLDDHYEPAQLLLSADGTYIVWRISGTYAYGFKDPRKPILTFPRPPWIKDTVDRLLNTANFQPSIKDQGSPGAGEGGSAFDSEGSELGS